jgi:DNA polymerase III subunit gamma/tau
MDKFIVSARKYRPQGFSTVVGQSHITTTLKNAIKNNQLAHAFLFCGPRGVGKTTCARILAKTINCENVGADGEACNKCHSCLSFNDGISMNIHELDAASNNSVDDIRTLVEQVRFAPQAGRYKVYIVDEVHMLSTSAFNAFLKTLEEPPPYAIFILATTEKHKILPTILSRCQIFDFKRITTADTVDHLQEICDKEEIKAEKPALQVIAQKSEGCMRDALSILDKIVSFTNGELTYTNTLEHLNILDADYYFRILDAMQQQNLSDALLLYDDINRKGFEGDLVLNGLAEFIRNLLVCKDEKVAALLEVVESFKDRYITAGKAADAAYLISGLNILNEAEINYKSARNKRLHVELALIKLCYLGQALQLTSGEPGGKKKQVDSLRPVSFRNIPAMELVGGINARTAGGTVKAAGSEGTAKTGGTGSGSYGQPDGGEEGRTENREDRQPENRKTEGQEGGAKLLIETPVKERLPAQTIRQGVTPVAGGSSLGSLSKIRQQFSNRQQQDESNSRKDLEPVALQKVWQEYADKLRENKNPAVQSMEMAVLRITNANSFEVVSSNNLEQKFIEGEKRILSEHIQQAFSNKTISFAVIVEERVSDNEGPTERPLNRREQFLQIIELYPLVKELKDRLKLELDY